MRGSRPGAEEAPGCQSPSESQIADILPRPPIGWTRPIWQLLQRRGIALFTRFGLAASASQFVEHARARNLDNPGTHGAAGGVKRLRVFPHGSKDLLHDVFLGVSAQ